MSPLDPLEILQVIGYSIGALLPLWMLFQLITHRRNLTNIERLLAALALTMGGWHTSNLHYASRPLRSRSGHLDLAASCCGHRRRRQYHFCLLVSASRSPSSLGQRTRALAKPKRTPACLWLLHPDNLSARCRPAPLDRGLRTDVHEAFVLRDPVRVLDRLRAGADRSHRAADRQKEQEPQREAHHAHARGVVHRSWSRYFCCACGWCR